ncbi:unnamed protein product [Durusdinium trenchii]|uniref:PRA1 family protein D (AtPRA1.D) (CAMV MOVEMENT PROTEIN-INTERACTING PROTEIN 7) (Prenylated Rab acceptor 5) n=2 Tax=Durusdinium trenchii TaxID=1381693 RepID=A0ABP0S2N1_9DINO
MAPSEKGQGEPTMTDFAGILLADLSSFTARALKDANQTLTAVETFVSPYTSHLRPWREFLDLELPELDSDADFLQRIVRNIAHFQANYLTIGSCVFALAVYCRTSWLLAMLLLLALWGCYFARGGLDPAWKPLVFGVEATASHRLALMYAGSLSLIFLVFGQVVLVLIGILGTLTMAHALCNATLWRLPATAAPNQQLRAGANAEPQRPDPEFARPSAIV